jgi:hypothetical protein
LRLSFVTVSEEQICIGIKALARAVRSMVAVKAMEAA